MGNEVHEKQKHHHNAADVGEAGMGEGKEMTKENGCGKQEEREQSDEILRLGNHSHKQDNAIDNQRTVDSACACAVSILLQIEINASYRKKQESQAKGEEMAQRYLGVVVHLERNHLLKMKQEVLPMKHQRCDGCIDPVWQYRRQDGCDKTAKCQGTEIALDEPIERYNPQQFWEEKRCHRQCKISEKGKEWGGCLIHREQREKRKQRKEHQHHAGLKWMAHNCHSEQDGEHRA